MKHKICLSLQLEAFGDNSYGKALEIAQAWCNGTNMSWSLADHPPKISVEFDTSEAWQESRIDD